MEPRGFNALARTSFINRSAVLSASYLAWLIGRFVGPSQHVGGSAGAALQQIFGIDRRVNLRPSVVSSGHRRAWLILPSRNGLRINMVPLAVPDVFQ